MRTIIRPESIRRQGTRWYATVDGREYLCHRVEHDGRTVGWEVCDA